MTKIIPNTPLRVDCVKLCKGKECGEDVMPWLVPMVFRRWGMVGVGLQNIEYFRVKRHTMPFHHEILTSSFLKAVLLVLGAM